MDWNVSVREAQRRGLLLLFQVDAWWMLKMGLRVEFRKYALFRRCVSESSFLLHIGII